MLTSTPAPTVTAASESSSAVAPAAGGSSQPPTSAPDGVELLSAQVPASATAQEPSQLGESLARATRLGDLAQPQAGSALVSSAPSVSSHGNALLLTAMAGAALALIGTAWEGARRQRVRVATGRTRGRRALR